VPVVVLEGNPFHCPWLGFDRCPPLKVRFQDLFLYPCLIDAECSSIKEITIKLSASINVLSKQFI